MFEKNWFDILDEWYHSCVLGQLKFATCRSYNLAIRQIKERMDNCDIKEIDELQLQTVLNEMASIQYSNSSINKVKIVMNSSIHYALLHHYINNNPIYRLRIPKTAPKEKVEALTINEQKTIENYCLQKNDLRNKATIFLFNTGLRSSELYNLKWSNLHINSNNPYISVEKSKTDDGVRIVPLNKTAYEIIKGLPKGDNLYIFTYKGGQLSGTIMSDHNKRIREKTGINPFTNHICRHTFATRALERGMNPKALSKILGHSSVAFTMSRYTTITKDFIFEQMKLFE